MIIRFNMDLSSQDLYANGDELAMLLGRDRDKDGKRVFTWPLDEKVLWASFDNPVLVSDNEKIAGLADYTTRETLFALFRSSHKRMIYEGTSLDFDDKKYIGVWSPSIDTLLFCRAMDKLDLRSARKVAELGSGSGFISKHALETHPGIESITLVDINKYAKLCAKDNIKDRRAKFVRADAVKYLAEKVDSIFPRIYDLILCNPPYLPRPKSIDDNAYEGIGLLIYLLDNAGRYLNKGGSLVTNISSLCEDVAIEHMNKSGLPYKKIDAMDVPLKVFNVLNDPVWMEFLLNKGLKKDLHDGHEYWQRLNIYQIRKE